MRGHGNDRGWYNNHHHGGNQKRENQMIPQNNPSRGNYFCYGIKGHWKNECRAPKHFGRIYQESFKEREMKVGPFLMPEWSHTWLLKNDDEAGPSQKYDDNVEANLTFKDDDFDGLDDINHFKVVDFFRDQN